MKTTLNLIRECSPCHDGWEKLLKHLGKLRADDDTLPILTVLESNGLDDAIWAMRAVKGSDREIRLFAVWCARQVQHLMTDKRSVKAIDVSERFANGLASETDLLAARDAALAAAVAAAVAAAGAAAGAAARAAAWDAAGAAAWADAGDAARSAARAAAWAASGAAAWDAAGDAAGDAAMDAQKQKLIEICDGRANERAI